MDNISSQPSQSPSEGTTLLLEGVLLDSAANQPVNFSAIEFRSGEDKISVDTDSMGAFSVQLPHKGNWIIEPDKHKYPTYYFFAPLTLPVQGGGNVGPLSVQGDNVANAHTLETFVKNVFVAAQNLFAEGMKQYDPKTLTQEEVQNEAAVVFKIVANALYCVIKDVTESELSSSEPKEEPLCGQSVAPASDQTDTQVAAAMCCGECQRRYANNAAMLQQCMCCPTPCMAC